MEILIIQILRMGDALQLIPLMQGIKQLFADARITLLTSRLGADILSPQPEVDEVFVLEKTEIATLMQGGTQDDALAAVGKAVCNLSPVLSRHWDWAINFSYTFATAQIGFLLDTKHFSGFKANRYRQYISREKWFAYSMASFVNRRYSVYNWVDINRHILGLRSVGHPPVMTVPDETLQKALAYLKQNNIDRQTLVGFLPGASGDYKRWPAEKFGRLGQILKQQHGRQILVFGDEAEKELGKQVCAMVGDGAFNLAGATDLDELKAYLSLCQTLVTNDTGPMHLAAAVGTPTVGLFFSTHFVETGPYGAGHVVLHPNLECFPCQNTADCLEKKCLEHIAPETVAKLVVERENLIASAADFLGEDRGRVKTYFSDFDPWGNLQWLPVEKRPVSFDTLQRIFLKLVWLYYADVLEDLGDAAREYIERVLARYDTTLVSDELCRRLDDYRKKLIDLDQLLEAGQAVAMAIQGQLLAGSIDVAAVNELGESLRQKETAIEEIGGRSSLNFISELLVVLQENIEKTTPLELSTKTVTTYRDVRAFAAGLARQAEVAYAILGGR